MPKKTKREKIIADYRKKLQLVQQLQITPSTPTAQSPAAGASGHPYRFVPTVPIKPTADSAANDLGYIKQDLLKTIVFAGLAIGGELALFWFWK